MTEARLVGQSSKSSKSSSTSFSSTTSTSTSTIIPASISTSSVPTAGSPITSAPTTSTPSPTCTNLPTNTTLPEKTATSSNSQAWIAGAVIGPIAAIAIVSGLIFWFKRRQNAKQQQPVPVVRLNEIWTPPPPNRTYAKVYEKSASSLQELE
ncbi:uncharacterized protein TRUGW13939_07612 [Talaromyces rugulosus]|uniref:Mid2 domain-containing protein n=1 Tax=Talaromyces rugulosus TaxID=121627 RepID=A0A7H8R2I9_TALRU|nr:uncharacterized protein TRUGW13939_07612 [Talaromyces rugulosus]QKX60467.1 hypothetical protein TRUGW13939_07612 [Talaromyces rugulosus]